MMIVYILKCDDSVKIVQNVKSNQGFYITDDNDNLCLIKSEETVNIAKSVIDMGRLYCRFTYYVTNEYKLYQYNQRPEIIKHLEDIAPSYTYEINVLIEKEVKSIKTCPHGMYILDIFGRVWIARVDNEQGFITRLNLLNITNCKKLIRGAENYISYIDNNKDFKKYYVDERREKIKARNIIDKNGNSFIEYSQH